MKPKRKGGFKLMKNMRKEIKNAIMLFALFNTINFITIVIGKEILALHFCCGVFAGLAFTEIIIGLLPESIYLKVKNFKKNYISFIN